ncbi:MAG: Replication initiation and membrane attachment [Pelotomaculum sp. PtaU1.Bin065]|nr:MAG: Replication initiation and membrane attachment [Pelotomaculum sp. PtaU1.Bin065]
MSEIVRGRSKGIMTIENYIEDGLLEIGSIDLAGFYGALKRFVDRRESFDSKAAMPWTVDLFCSKFKIGKQRFYRLSELLWQVGLLDVKKESGVIDTKKGTMGWRNQYIIHDYPDYDGPLRLVREGSYKYKKANAGSFREKPVPIEENFDAKAGESEAENNEVKGEIKDNEGVFLYRNTSENQFGGISNTGIPATEIPVTGIPTAGISAVERHIKLKRYNKQKRYKKQDKEINNSSNHSFIHHNDHDRARAKPSENQPVDMVDNVDKVDSLNGEEKSVGETTIKTILKSAGFEGLPVEVEYISKWFDIFPLEMIEYAVSKSVLNGKKSLPYITGIFEDWVKKGVKTIEQAEKETRYDSVMLKLKNKRGMLNKESELRLPDPQVFRDYQNQRGNG